MICGGGRTHVGNFRYFGGKRHDGPVRHSVKMKMGENMADILLTITGIIALVLLWVMLYDSNRFVTRQYTVSDSRIKKQCRAVVLADLHNKRYGRNNERLLAAIRECHPDVVLIAGDILTAKPGAPLEPALNFLKEIARDYPVYYANGNHEHRLKLYPKVYGDMAERYSGALREMGLEPLVNAHADLPEYGITVYGSEIDKEFYKRLKAQRMSVDYLPGILGQAREDVYTVLLAHNPEYFPQYAAWGADLTLSGHIHGGVARVPVWGRGVISPSWHLFPKYDGGIFREGDSVMVLSRGLGTHTIPVRIFNPAELWIVDFEKE